MSRPFDLVIPLLGIYSKEEKSYKNKGIYCIISGGEKLERIWMANNG